MGLNEKEQVFKVHWTEKLRMVFKLIYIPVLLFWGWRFSLDFSINEIFFKCFLTVLLSIIIFLILSIYAFNKKILISDGILIYYERGKEVWCRRIGKDNVRIFNENNLFYGDVKYLSIDYCYVVISLFGKKNCLKLEKIICEFQLEKEEIENTVFEIPKKELLVEKCKNIFKNNAVKIIIVLIVVKYSDNIFLNYFLIIIILGAIILQIVSLIRMKIYTPKIIKIFSNFISTDDEKYSKYDIKKLMITSPNTKSETIDFGYRILKIFGNNEKKVYTLITSKNSEFKNSGKDEDYETFYKEIVKFCIKNEIEYELV